VNGLWSARRAPEPPADETRVWTTIINEQAGAEGAPVRTVRSANRRRVLFAAGGLMLLGVGGVAAATASASGAKTSPGAAGGPGGRPLAGGSSPSSAASHSASGAGSASAATSTGAPSSNTPSSPGSGSASGSGSGSPSDSPSSPSSSSSSSSSSSQSTSGGGTVATKPQFYVDDQGPLAIALTMDDGPHPIYTPQVLEIFRQYNIKATFNMVGQQVGANLSLVREVSAEGHTITNHTWDHSDLPQCTYSQILSQIDRCNDALANANQHPTILRAPYGNWSRNVFEACAARNLRPVDWSVDPRDWDTAHVDTQEIVANVMAHTHAHDIVLEHDGGGNRSNTVAALKLFIPRLLDKGFHFVAM
jgi:peptidoglycan/xylan/chitin deacetylase (PgdA/CDA1 family)